jgi:transposase
MSRTSEVVLEQVRLFAGAGMKPQVIATELGLPLQRVYCLRKRVGLHTPMKPLPASVEQQILEAYKKHGRLKIARALGLSVGKVSVVLRRHNAPRPLGRGGRPSKKKPEKHAMAVATKAAILARRELFEQQIADEFNLSVDFVEKFLRRRKARRSRK